MALSVGNVVLLAIGVILLATGAWRAALYLGAPEPAPQVVSQWRPGTLPATPAGLTPEQVPPTRAPLPSSTANRVEAVPAMPRPPATPNALPTDPSPLLAGQEVAGSSENAGSFSSGSGKAGAAAATPVVDAMKPLGNKFARIWHRVQETGEFIYYDPKVPGESTLGFVLSGKTYLILVTESVTLMIDGQELELVCDDGDCWNKVIWP